MYIDHSLKMSLKDVQR